MGPTGVRTKIPTDKETIMVLGGRFGAAYIQTVGPALRAAGNKVIYFAGFVHREEVYCQDQLEAAADVIVWITEVGEPIAARRDQDRAATGYFIDVVQQYAAGELEHNGNALPMPLSEVDRVLVVGTKKLLKMTQHARQNGLSQYLTKNPLFVASVYGPMQ